MKYIQLQLIFLSLEILYLGGQRVNLQIKCRKFGYEMQTLRSATKCLHWNRDNVTFTEAKEHCEANGGFLATFKTEDEVALATTSKIWHFWVGLDDMQSQGMYRWHDDGTIAQNVKDIFKFQEMTRRPISADCASFMPSFFSHVLTFCDTKAGFVCEIRAAS
ncbi:macrophage mannose receptor 1-like isoform X1 [Biomphalaria glabrata]|nr:macrophage mannose receptor 1-like isoform X1 [Biomphalaria glabrata]